LSGDPAVQRSSLFGLVNFRPRLTVVLIFLTLTVAVVGYRIARDAGTRRVEGMAQEAQRIFAAAQKEGTKDAPPDPVIIEEKILEWLGMKVTLPRDESLFSYKGATRERIGKQTAAAVSLAFGEDRYLLLIVRPDPVRGVEAPSPLFSEASFLSWENEGNSFVYWEKDGAKYVLVSNVDLSRTFDLVRRYFT
jgi:hypothetical protein